jgi:uncharacterized protein YcbX
MPRVAEIYRYPVKGLSAERLDHISLSVGEVIPFDRAFAIENGPSGFNPQSPQHVRKIAFLMLMRNERLAELATRFDGRTQTLTIRKDGALLLESRLDTVHGRQAVEAFFDSYSAEELRGPAKVLSAPGHSFQDTSTGKVVSLINLETVRDIERRIAASINPLRFRGNLHVEGLAAWDEFSWVGKEVMAGGVTLTVTKRIDRCAAVNVDPLTGARDLNIPQIMMREYGHLHCGVYLKVTAAGELRAGDEIDLANAPSPGGLKAELPASANS